MAGPATIRQEQSRSKRLAVEACMAAWINTAARLWMRAEAMPSNPGLTIVQAKERKRCTYPEFGSKGVANLLCSHSKSGATGTRRLKLFFAV